MAQFDAKQHLNHLIEVRDMIDLNQVTVLTGGNGRGKSFIRKQIMAMCWRDKINVWTCSMDKRAGLDDSLGAGNVFNRDCEWLPTSVNTLSTIQNFDQTKNSFGIMDEIEIGMAEESQLGIALYINKHLEQYRKNNKGLLIITHSKYLVSTIQADNFINLEGMTKEEWLNRPIIATDFDQLQADSQALFQEIQSRSKRK